MSKWRRSGLMFSAHVSGSSGVGSSITSGLGQDTLLSQWLSPARCTNEYR